MVKELHKKPIISCKYFYNEITKIDLIITTSYDNHIKVINFIKMKF